MNLKRAIEIIEGGGWCAIRFITADVTKGSGGKVIEFAKCRIARNRAASSPPLEGLGEASPLEGPGEAAVRPRNPNHNLHFTRLMELPNKQLRKVHPPLITHLNQEELI